MNDNMNVAGRKLPPYDLTPHDHFAGVLTGSKKLLIQNQSNNMEIKRYQEFSTTFILDQVKNDSELRQYVPESWFKDSAKVSREYLW